jgi:hypothetical protein
MWDCTKAVASLDANAHSQSIGLCAEYTRMAIEAGGVTVVHVPAAKDYGNSLITVGFVALAAPPAAYMAGDVGIVQPIDGHPYGHMAMYDGKSWVSDFVQMHGLYPSASYRAVQPPFTIYRYPATPSAPQAMPSSPQTTQSAAQTTQSAPQTTQSPPQTTT